MGLVGTQVLTIWGELFPAGWGWSKSSLFGCWLNSSPCCFSLCAALTWNAKPHGHFTLPSPSTQIFSPCHAGLPGKGEGWHWQFKTAFLILLSAFFFDMMLKSGTVIVQLNFGSYKGALEDSCFWIVFQFGISSDGKIAGGFYSVILFHLLLLEDPICYLVQSMSFWFLVLNYFLGVFFGLFKQQQQQQKKLFNFFKSYLISTMFSYTWINMFS